MLPFVRHVARRYANRGESLEDLVQVGCIGLLKAVDRFDLARGVKLTTFAEPTISGEIKRHFRDRGWSVHMPRDLQELHAAIGRESPRLSGANGREPTAAELAERLQTSPERIVEALLAGRNYNASSLDAPDAAGNSRISHLNADDAGFDRAEMMVLLRAGTRILPPRERRIVFLRYFDDLSQHEIARRVGMSQMHVSRLLRQSLERMRAELDGQPAAGAATAGLRAA